MADDVQSLLKNLKDKDSRYRAAYQADPLLPAGMYEDMERANSAGIPYGQSYGQIREAARPSLANPDEQMNQVAIQVATHLASVKKLGPKEKGFWTKVNEWIGTGLSLDPLPGRGKEKETFTDQAIDILDFTQHLWRAGRELQYQNIGRERGLFGKAKGPKGDVLGIPTSEEWIKEWKGVFSPKAWAAAWGKTRDPEGYFVGEDPPTDLPEFGRTVAKRLFVGHSPEDIANDYRIDHRLIEMIGSSSEARRYMSSLHERQVSIGRDIVRAFPLEETQLRAPVTTGEKVRSVLAPFTLAEGTQGKLFALASGTLDLLVALFAEPDFFVGEVFKGVRAAWRSPEFVAEQLGGLDNLRHYSKMKTFLSAATKEKSPAALIRKYKIPPELAASLAAANSEDVAFEIVKRAVLGVGEGRPLLEIPRTRVLAKISDRLYRFDGPEDELTIGARLYRRGLGMFGDEPKSVLNPRDKADVYDQVKGLLNTFPTAFTLRQRDEVLDSVLRAKTPQAVFQVVTDTVDTAGKRLKVRRELRKPMTQLFNTYGKLRAFNIDPETGMDRLIRETIDGAMQRALPHLWSELTQKIPLFSPMELRKLRWAQGSFTKNFITHPVAGQLWMGAHFLTRAIFVPIMLITRIGAYPIRNLLDVHGRMIASGTGLIHPIRYTKARSLAGEYAKYGAHPARPSFWAHPVKYVMSLSDDPDVPGELLLGRSKLFQISDEGTRFRRRGARPRGQTAVEVEFDKDPYALHGWQWMLSQLAEDPVSRQLLSGRSLEEVSDWLLGDGRKFFDDLKQAEILAEVSRQKEVLAGGGQLRLPWAATDEQFADEYVASVIDRITSHVHGNEPVERLLRGVASGEVPARELTGDGAREFLATMSNPPPWVKRHVALEGGSDVGLWARIQEVLFKYLGDIPESRLGKIPGYAMVARDTENRLIEFAKREGKFLDDTSRYVDEWRGGLDDVLEGLRRKPEMAPDKQAQISAMIARVERRLERGPSVLELDNLAARDGFLTPRLATESAKAHAVNYIVSLQYDPSKRKRIFRILETEMPFAAAWWDFTSTWMRIMGTNPQQIGRAARLLDFSLDSPDQADPFFVEGMEGRRALVDPLINPVGWFIQKITGTQTQFASPLESFNLATQNIYPAFGPMAQFIASSLAVHKPGWEDGLRWIGGSYGLDYAREQGVLRYAQLGIEAFVPAWARTMREGFESPESSVNANNQAIREFQQIALERWKSLDNIPWSDPEQMQEVMEEAINRAKAISFLLGFAKMIWPGGLIRQYPQQPLVDRFRALRDTLGEEEALKQIRKEWGPGAVFLIEPMSRASMPATRKAFQMYKDEKHRKLAQDYGGMFWSLVENEVQKGQKFEYSVYKWQHASGERKPRTIPYQLNPQAREFAPGWIEATEISEAWRIVDDARARGEAMVAAGQLDEEGFGLTMKLVRTRVALEFPSWSISQIQMTNQVYKLRKFRGDMEVLAKSLEGRDSAKGLQEFVRAWDSAQRARQNLGLSPDSFEGESSEALTIRRALLRAGEKIADLYPDFRPFFVRQVRFILETEPSELQPPVVRLLEDLPR